MRGTLLFDDVRRVSHHDSPPMVPAAAFAPLIRELSRTMTWTHLQMACGVSKSVLSAIAAGRKHHVQQATAERLRRLVELLEETP